jgi:predicted PurR-regulated permease PerM
MARTGPSTSPAPRFIILASSCIIVAALFFARDVLIPVALAMLLSFLLTPVVRRFERAKLGRIASVLIAVVLMFALIGILAYVVTQQLLDLGENLDQYKDNIVTKVERLRPKGGGVLQKLEDVGTEVQKRLDQPEAAASTQTTKPTDKIAEVTAQELAARTREPRTVSERSKPTTRATQAGAHPATVPWQPTKENPLPVAVVQPKAGPLAQLATYLGLVLGPLGTAGIVIVFVIFMLLQREDLRSRIVRLASAGGGQLTIATQALDDASTRISKYLVAQAIVNGSYGIAVSLGLWIIGYTLGRRDVSGTDNFPSFILWGLICALLRFIPYIGPWIGSSLPLIIALAVYRGFAVFGATIGMFVLIELVSNNLMEPWLYATSTGISTVAVLVSAVFWTWLWGPIGLLLSTPLTVVLVVLGKYIPQLGFLDILLGDEPVLEPPQRLYQRLLALDQEEATELVREYRAKLPLEDVYDTVLLPMLALAESDQHRSRLEGDRLKFIHQAVRDIVDELGDDEEARIIRESAKEVEAAAKDDAAAEVLASPTLTPATRERTVLPNGCTVNVVCLPAHDDADEIVNTMLSQLLALQHYCVTPVSVTKLASEMVNTVETSKANVVIVSAMPPSAVAHSRYLCKRVHARFPQTQMVVGLWSYKGDIRRAKDRIACAESVQLCTTLRDALDEIQQLATPIIAKAAEAIATTSSPQPRP